ncbi:MAG TPA: hypothetical protein VLL48_10565, partial [Longimicrobiales bacterium]|nr:hypothetical protein [Longimicrobiales bacterium]
LIDLSEVRVLDFSCADEVVAKLLQRHAEPDRSPVSFFVFRGVRDTHLDPMQAVLQRQSLAAVVETGGRGFRLIGSRSGHELRVWRAVEEEGGLGPGSVDERFPDDGDRRVLVRLGRRRLVFPLPGGGYRALSTLVPDLS